jgi:RNA recognition motif-containing protein
VQVKAIYVGNLPETVTEEKLRDVFKAYGEVSIGSSSRHKYRTAAAAAEGNLGAMLAAAALILCCHALVCNNLL